MGRNPRTLNNSAMHLTKAEIQAKEESTPIYQSQEFVMPEDLTNEEAKVWEWLVKVFRETTNCMVSDADVHLMQLYCRAKVLADYADKKYKENPRYYVVVLTGKDKDGNPKTTTKVNEWYKIRNDNMVLCLKYFNELGLTPLARARAGVRGANAKKEADIFAELLQRTDE